METVTPDFLEVLTSLTKWSSADLQHRPFPKLFYFQSQLLPKDFEDHINSLRKHKIKLQQLLAAWLLQGCYLKKREDRMDMKAQRNEMVKRDVLQLQQTTNRVSLKTYIIKNHISNIKELITFQAKMLLCLLSSLCRATVLCQILTW